MSLRELAEQDLGAILENSSDGFGWPITVTDPTGTTASLVGFSNDIAQVIDPDTGVAVSGRLATVAIRIGLLAANGLGIPRAIADSASKPWVVTFADINGNSYSFKVAESSPDRALGLVSCILGLYQ